jgi:hypothetical protein
MHRRISRTLNALRPDRAAKPGTDFIGPACRAAGHSWCDTGLLTPAALMPWFLLPVLHGNTALSHVSLLAGRVFTAGAFCQARARLPLALFRVLLRAMVPALIPDTQAHGRGRGHRTFLGDGSSFSMPDTPVLPAHFGQPGNQAQGCGFPVAHRLALFQAGTGLLLEVAAAPVRSHDRAGIGAILPLRAAGDVLVADRGFCSFAPRALLRSQGVHGVFRRHPKQSVDFTPGRAHARAGQQRVPKGRPRRRWISAPGLRDQVVEDFKPARCPEWRSAAESRALPESIMVRQLRSRITAPGFRRREVTRVTTLLDAELDPADALAELSGTRGRVEENLKAWKQTMKRDVLKCMTGEGVRKELTMDAVASNLVRVTMCQAAGRQGVAAERVSFRDALRWRRAAEEGGRCRSGWSTPRVRGGLSRGCGSGVPSSIR